MSGSNVLRDDDGKGRSRFPWREIVTRKPKRIIQFYTSLLNWQTSEIELGETGTYTVFRSSKDGKPFAGVQAMDTMHWGDSHGHWLPYISVDDVDDVAERVPQLGGSVEIPPTDITDVGRFCLIQDPDGARVALLQELGDDDNNDS